MIFHLTHWFFLSREPCSILCSLWCRKAISDCEAGLCALCSCLQNVPGNPAAQSEAGQRHRDTATPFRHRNNLPQSRGLEAVARSLIDLALCIVAAWDLFLVPEKFPDRVREMSSWPNNSLTLQGNTLLIFAIMQCNRSTFTTLLTCGCTPGPEHQGKVS